MFQNDHPDWFDRASAPHAFLKEVQRILESGDDLNGFPPTKYWRFKSDRPLEHWINDNSLYTKCEFQRYFRFLLQNGLSFFYCTPRESDCSLFEIFYIIDRLYSLPPIVNGIAQQLLALGYGRRELHPADIPVRDEQLDDTRDLLNSGDLHRNASRVLQSLVNRFDAGFLSLLQLSQIAIQRIIGGANFARRVFFISPHIPHALFQYVADPTELMQSGYVVYIPDDYYDITDFSTSDNDNNMLDIDPFDNNLFFNEFY